MRKFFNLGLDFSYSAHIARLQRTMILVTQAGYLTTHPACSVLALRELSDRMVC
jgi:hypothetical protein